MDSDLNFNSDSTYCSLYENSTQTTKGKGKVGCKINYSELLDNIHKKILLHWEGKQLIGSIQAKIYMKQISKMNLKSYKDQYFAEKIQSSLFKIFNLGKAFEKSISLYHPEKSDPIKDFSFTQDLKFIKNTIDDPKQILLGTTSINTESFPLDILTNNNFVSYNSELNNAVEKSKNCVAKDKIQNESYKEGEINFIGNIVSNQDMFPSGSNEIFIEHSPKSSNINTDTGLFLHESNILNSDNAESENKKRISDLSSDDMTIIDELGLSQKFGRNMKDRNDYDYEVNNNTFCPSNGIDVVEYVTSSTHLDSKLKTCNKNDYGRFDVKKEMCKNQIIPCDKNFTENSNDVKQVTQCNTMVNKEYTDVMEKIKKITVGEEASLMDIDNSTNMEISETLLSDENQCLEKVIFGNSVKTLNMKHMLELGHESKTGISWQDIQKELESGEQLARTVNHTLDMLFEKLCLSECECAQKECNERLNKVGILHNFSLDDKTKIDMESLFRKNRIKLEKISEEFSKKLCMGRIEAVDDDNVDNYEGLDWRKLLT